MVASCAFSEQEIGGSVKGGSRILRGFEEKNIRKASRLGSPC